MSGDISVIVEEVRLAGFRFAPAEQFRALLTPAALAEWPSFAASWEDLGVDTYMADGGRYRRRRRRSDVNRETVSDTQPLAWRFYCIAKKGWTRKAGWRPILQADVVHPISANWLNAHAMALRSDFRADLAGPKPCGRSPGSAGEAAIV